MSWCVGGCEHGVEMGVWVRSYACPSEGFRVGGNLCECVSGVRVCESPLEDIGSC